MSVYNTGNNVLRNVRIHYANLLGPSQFGLDDKYMSKDAWVKTPVLIPQIAPSEIATFYVDGFNVQERYDGPKHAKVIMDFLDPSEDPKIVNFFGNFYNVEVEFNFPNAHQSLQSF
ncbi:hypothetical protein [Methylotenera sp.]|uniref:hypothetical protein n=1 Tax=Methylotenera sp. TaxID=2051956 RepID=UPI002489F443|nr:hypothetical protein [Methylotenera sp.]MDI1298789.1 hypothetical protein [Methylotenera sp.]